MLVRFAILCDDVRKEDNGKGMLIGVYSGQIVLPSVPALMKFTYWVDGSVTSTETESVEFKIDILDDKGTSKNTGLSTIEVVPDGISTTAIGVLSGAIPIIEPGSLVLSYKVDGNWQEILAKKVLVLAPTESSPTQVASEL
jgi:hypothetical protein